jgi:hypothetical protein
MFEMDRSAEVIDNYEYEVRNLLKKLRDVSEAAERAGWRAESGVTIPEYIEELGKKVREYESSKDI